MIRAAAFTAIVWAVVKATELYAGERLQVLLTTKNETRPRSSR